MTHSVSYLLSSEQNPPRSEYNQRTQSLFRNQLERWNPQSQDKKERLLRLASRAVFVALQILQVLLPLAMHYLPPWSIWGVFLPSILGLTISYMFLNYQMKTLAAPLKQNKEMKGYLKQVLSNPHDKEWFPIGQWEAKQMDERCLSDTFALKRGIKQIHPEAADIKSAISRYNLEVDSLHFKQTIAARIGGDKEHEREWNAIRLAVKEAKKDPETYQARMRVIQEKALAVKTGGVVDFDFSLEARAKINELKVPPPKPPKTREQRYNDLEKRLAENGEKLVPEELLKDLLDWNEKHSKFAQKPIVQIPPKEAFPKAILTWCEKRSSWKDKSPEDLLMAQLRMVEKLEKAKDEFDLLDKKAKIAEIEKFENTILDPLERYIANEGHSRFEAFYRGVLEGVFGSKKPVTPFFTPEQQGLNSRLLTSAQRDEFKIDQRVQVMDARMVRTYRAKVWGIDVPLQLLVVVEAIFWMYVPNPYIFWGFALVNVIGITISYLMERRLVKLEQEKQSVKLQYRLRYFPDIQKVPGTSTQLNRLQRLEKKMGLEGVQETWGHLLVHGDKHVPEPKSEKDFDRQRKKLAKEVQNESARYLKGRYEKLKAYFQTDPLSAFEEEYEQLVAQHEIFNTVSKKSAQQDVSAQLLSSMKLALLTQGSPDFFALISQLFTEALSSKKIKRASERNPAEILSWLSPDFTNRTAILVQLKFIPKEKLLALQNQVQTELSSWLDHAFTPLVKTSVEAGKRGLEKMLHEMLSLSFTLNPPQKLTHKNRLKHVKLRLKELLGEERASKYPEEWLERIKDQIPGPKMPPVSPPPLSEEEREKAKSESEKKRKEARLEQIAEDEKVMRYLIGDLYNTEKRVTNFKGKLSKNAVPLLTEPVSAQDLFLLREALLGTEKRKRSMDPEKLLTELHLGQIDTQTCMAGLKQVSKKKLWELGSVLNSLFKIQKLELTATPKAIQKGILNGERELFELFLERCVLTMDKKVLDKRLKRLFKSALSGPTNLESQKPTLPLFLTLASDCSNATTVGKSLKQCKKEEIEALQNYCKELTQKFYHKWGIEFEGN